VENEVKFPQSDKKKEKNSYKKKVNVIIDEKKENKFAETVNNSVITLYCKFNTDNCCTAE